MQSTSFLPRRAPLIFSGWVLGALYFIWLTLSAFMADQILTAYAKNIVHKEADALEQQADILVTDFRRNLDQLYAVPRIFGLHEELASVLSQAPILNASETVADRKAAWSSNLLYSKINNHFSKISTMMGVQVLYVLSPEGDCILSSNATQADSFVGSNFAQRDYFKLAKKNGRGFQYAVGKVSNLPGFYFSAPIYLKDQLAGVAVAKLNYSAMRHWVDHSEAFISDANGVIILAKDPRLEMRSLPNSRLKTLSAEEIQARYHRTDFQPLNIQAWHTPTLPELSFIHQDVPIILTKRHLSDGDELESLVLHLNKQVNVESFAGNRLLLFGSLALLGAVLILLFKLRQAAQRKRDELAEVQQMAFIRLQKLSNRVPGMIFEFQLKRDGSTCFPYASDAIADIFHLSPAQVIKDASLAFDTLHPDDLASVNESIQTSASQLTPWRHEFRVRYEAGIEHWLLGNAMPEREVDGSTRWYGFITDITEPKLIEQDLNNAKEDLQLLLDSMAEGAYEIDYQGNFKFINRAFLKLLAYEHLEEVIGQSVHQLIQHSTANGEPLAQHQLKILQVLETHQPINVSDEVFWCKDGRALNVEYWAYPVMRGGVVKGVMVTFIDISHRILVEQERVKMSVQLFHKNRQLLDYKEKVEDEEVFAKDFIRKFCALDQINDPAVRFSMQSADQFSGDMIAVTRTPDGRLRLLLADSTGHGLTSALAVIPITGPFYRMTSKGFGLAEIAIEINSRVREYLHLPRYVACVLMEIDEVAREIQVWNGGCPDVLLLNTQGTEILHRFKSTELPMGIATPAEFSAKMTTLKFPEHEFALLACSDGATELNLESNQEIGYESLLLAAQQSSCETFFDRLLQTIEHHLNHAPPADDIAMLLVQLPLSKH